MRGGGGGGRPGPLGVVVPNIKNTYGRFCPPSIPHPNFTSEVTRMAVTALPGTVTQHVVLNGFVVGSGHTQDVVERPALECNTNKLRMSTCQSGVHILFIPFLLTLIPHCSDISLLHMKIRCCKHNSTTNRIFV